MTDDADLIAGRYRQIARVGSGGMGVVWRARDELLGRTVALKELLTPSGVTGEAADEAARRAMREARIAARLHHPNVIGVYDVVDHGGRPYLVMEFLASRSLADMLDVGVILPVDEVARIGARVASALAAAHDAGIVHRDVKPGNVLLADDGAVKLTDFGISSAVGDNTTSVSGVLVGTPSYLAPEVARGRAADSRSDVYCLGATLYAAVEGRPPFGVDENAVALLYRVVHGEITPPRNAGLLAPVLTWMLERDPEIRPTMPQAQEALEAVADAVHAARGEARVIEPRVMETPGVIPGVTPGIPISPSPRETVSLPELTVRQPERSGAALPPGRGRRRVVGAGLAAAVLSGAGILALIAYSGNDNPASAASQMSVNRPGSPSHPSTSPPHSVAPSVRTVATNPATTKAAPAAALTPAPTTTTTSQSLTGQLTATIIDYYQLLPANLDQGWGWMTADYQQNHAGGRSGYQAFWQQIQRVAVSHVTATAPATVDATIDYYYKDGRTVEERTGFGLVTDQGRWKIASSSVLGG